MKFGINNPAWLQAAGNTENAIVPFVITSLEDGNVVSLPIGTKIGSYSVIERRVNDGEWERSPFSTSDIVLNAGDQLFFRNYKKASIIDQDANKAFLCTKKVNISGDYVRLFFASEDKLLNQGLKNSFKELPVVSAEGLILYPQKPKSRFYASLFMGCTELVSAPILTANDLSDGSCYAGMFDGASKLNKVVCLATLFGSTSPGSDWLRNVAETGEFIKKSGVEFPTGSIPSGWTVIEQ